MFKALQHNVRRRILLKLSRGEKSFTYLYETLGVSSSLLTYHLDVLDGLISKKGINYQLSELGVEAVTMFKSRETEPTMKPSLNFLYKYLAFLLILVIFTPLSNTRFMGYIPPDTIISNVSVTLRSYQNRYWNTIFPILFMLWPAVLGLIMREYWIVPLNEKTVVYSRPFHFSQ